MSGTMRSISRCHRQRKALCRSCCIRPAAPRAAAGLMVIRLEPSCEMLVDRPAVAAGADRHHADHRGDADDDAEHRQARTAARWRAGRNAVRIVSYMFTLSPPPRGRRRPRGTRRPSSLVDAISAVANMNDALGVGGDVRLVGDEDDRDARRRSAAEQRHDLRAGARVEVPGRLVGQDDAGSLTSARAMATRCCCPPDSSVRLVVHRGRPARPPPAAPRAARRSLGAARRRRSAAARRSRGRVVRGSRLNC